MKRFVLMHACENWVVISEHDEVTQAVEAREAYIESGGVGPTVIFEYHDPVSAYAWAKLCGRLVGVQRTTET